ncbi:MAG: YfbK domain-containing protein, partial [Pseudomonadota bacterium]
AGRRIDPLRYATTAEEQPADPAAATAVTPQSAEAPPRDELAFIKLRYKQPEETVSRLISRAVTADDIRPADTLSDDMRFAAAVAGFGQLLGQDQYLDPSFDLDAVIELATDAKGRDEFGQRAEFVQLVRQAKTAQDMR